MQNRFLIRKKGEKDAYRLDEIAANIAFTDFNGDGTIKSYIIPVLDYNNEELHGLFGEKTITADVVIAGFYSAKNVLVSIERAKTFSPSFDCNIIVEHDIAKIVDENTLLSEFEQ